MSAGVGDGVVVVGRGCVDVDRCVVVVGGDAVIVVSCGIADDVVVLGC